MNKIIFLTTFLFSLFVRASVADLYTILNKLPTWAQLSIDSIHIVEDHTFTVYRAHGINYFKIPTMTKLNEKEVLKQVILVADSTLSDTRLTKDESLCVYEKNLEICKNNVLNFEKYNSRLSNEKKFNIIYEVYNSRDQILETKLSPRNFFAEHLSEYLLNEMAYTCQYPALSFYFSKLSGRDDISYSSCEQFLTLKFSTPRYNPVVIDPRKIYDIQVVKVAKGKGMSRWGHIMFKLVMCPDGQKNKDVCINNIKEHYIFSLHEDLKSTNVINGFIGLSRIVGEFFTFQEAYYGYTIAQQRELQFFSLNLNQSEIVKFLSLILEINHHGLGSWNHIFNNCTSTANLILNYTLNLTEKGREFNAFTPDQLEKQIFLNRAKL